MDENKALAEDIGRLQDEMSYRGKAHQQLVTDEDGKAQWEDQLAYDGRIEISWDGDTTGRVSFIEPQMHDIYYKISDLTPTKEEIIGGTIKFSRNYSPLVITQDDIHGFGEEVYVIGGDGAILVSFVDNLDAVGVIIPEKGIYMQRRASGAYTNSLIYGKIKQLDEKFLPSVLTQPLNIVFIQQNVEVKSSITCNLTYEQIREQIDNDLPIIATFRQSGYAQRYIIISYEIGKDYIAFFTKVDKSDGFEYHSDGTFSELTVS